MRWPKADFASFGFDKYSTDMHRQRIRAAAQADNRRISDLMETATLRFLEQVEFADEQEMEEIRSDKTLLKSLKAGSTDIKKIRYRTVSAIR
jgi:hypothetical protein